MALRAIIPSLKWQPRRSSSTLEVLPETPRERIGVGLGTLLRVALCLQATVIESHRFRDGILYLTVRPYRRDQNRCSRCHRPASFYDRLTKRRRWRSIDLGSMRVFLEANTHRVRCAEHGVVVAHVPWARPKSRFTIAMQDLACWMATHSSQTVVADFLRVTWRSVGSAIKNSVTQADWPVHTLDLRRIGIDEISYRRGQNYITIVIDHDSGRLIWAAPGRSKEVVAQFFEVLGEARCAQIEIVTRDAASWISSVVSDMCPNAIQCMDPFHVVQWAVRALDAVRIETWRSLKALQLYRASDAVKGSIWVLRRNRSDLTVGQVESLASIQEHNKMLYRAYLLKEQLRLIFRLPLDEALRLLDRWLVWARLCRIPQFSDLAKTIASQKEEIRATLIYRHTQARVEGMNGAIRLITRRAYGFHSADSLIGLAMLSLGGLAPALPGRVVATQ